MNGLLAFFSILGGLGGLATVFVVVRESLERRRRSDRPVLYYSVNANKWDLAPFLRALISGRGERENLTAPDKAGIITLEIWNGGYSPISKEMFEHPFEVPIGPDGVEVVAYEVVDRIAETLPVRVHVTPNSQIVVVEPLLLNPGEGFALRISIVGRSYQFLSLDDIKPVARVRSLKGPERLRDAEPPRDRSSLNAFLLFAWLVWGYAEAYTLSNTPGTRLGDVVSILALVVTTQSALVVIALEWSKKRKAVTNPFRVPSYLR